MIKNSLLSTTLAAFLFSAAFTPAAVADDKVKKIDLRLEVPEIMTPKEVGMLPIERIEELKKRFGDRIFENLKKGLGVLIKTDTNFNLFVPRKLLDASQHFLYFMNAAAAKTLATTGENPACRQWAANGALIRSETKLIGAPDPICADQYSALMSTPASIYGAAIGTGLAGHLGPEGAAIGATFGASLDGSRAHALFMVANCLSSSYCAATPLGNAGKELTASERGIKRKQLMSEIKDMFTPQFKKKMSDSDKGSDRINLKDLMPRNHQELEDTSLEGDDLTLGRKKPETQTRKVDKSQSIFTPPEVDLTLDWRKGMKFDVKM